MSDHSLMNPDFLKKELSDCTELYAETQTFVRELDIDANRIGDIIRNAPRGYSNSITLSSSQAREIAEYIVMIQIHKYRMTVARKTMISQYKQLLNDRRYRIATKLLNLFT